jgi:hypothetical protein
MVFRDHESARFTLWVQTWEYTSVNRRRVGSPLLICLIAILGLACGCMLAMACASAGAWQFARGQEELKAGNLSRAIELLRDAADAEPENEEYARVLEDAVSQGAAAELSEADAARDRSDRFGEVAALERAAEYAPGNPEVSRRLTDLRADLERDSKRDAARADALAAEYGDAAAAHVALLLARASRLRRSRDKGLQDKALAARKVLRLQTQVVVRFDCESPLEICEDLRDVSESYAAAMAPVPESVFAYPDGVDAPGAERVRLQIRGSGVDFSKNVFHGPVEKNSEFVANYREEVNPAYEQAVVNYQVALQNYNEWRVANAANPGLISVIGLITAQNKLNEAELAVGSIQPTVLVPEYAPYSFSEYEFGDRAVVRTVVQVFDEKRGHLLLKQEIQGVAENLSPIRVGLHPNDRYGYRDEMVDQSLPLDLEERALSDLKGNYRTFLRGIHASLHKRLADALGPGDPPPRSSLLATRALMLLETGMPSSDDPMAAIERLLSQNIPVIESDVDLADPPPIKVGHALPPVSARAGPAGASAVRVPRRSSLPSVIALCQPAVATIETAAGQGSGFFVAPGGVLATNDHVVEGATNIVVRTSDGALFLGKVLWKSAETDISLLKIDEEYDYLPLKSTQGLEVGAEVIAIGAPKGLSYTTTRGIISQIRHTAGPTIVQHDAAINPGSSGGPLITLNGEVVGINTSKLREAEGLGFAVSATELKKALLEIPSAP